MSSLSIHGAVSRLERGQSHENHCLVSHDGIFDSGSMYYGWFAGYMTGNESQRAAGRLRPFSS